MTTIRRTSITLSGSAKTAAQELVHMKIQFEERRAEIFAKYEAEMRAFAATHQARVAALFTKIHEETDTVAAEGWTLEMPDGEINLVPVIPQVLMAAIIEQAATSPKLH